MVDHLFDSNQIVNTPDQENIDNSEAENDVVLQFNNIGLEGDNEEGYEGDDEVGNAVANYSGGYIYVVIVFRKRIGRVLKAKINNIAFTDVSRCSKENVEKKNMKVTSYCHLVCQEK